MKSESPGSCSAEPFAGAGLLIGVQQVALRLGVHRDTIVRMAKRGDMPPVRRAGGLRFRTDEIRTWWASGCARWAPSGSAPAEGLGNKRRQHATDH